ncbi:MAG: LysM peptidoglycan-binding domain-containing protein [Methylotenera sp.]|nr:LysM peptidoglycan-binding domain-containing protein [Methylotenera sp.]
MPAHAESNVTGEEITISPEEAVKPNPKDLASTENTIPKISDSTGFAATIDRQIHDETIGPQEVINIGSDDLWGRIKNGYAIPDSTSSLVARHENWYSSRPDYIKRMVERSQRYLFHIVEEVEKRGMPTEIALLPMIESAYNPQAYSTSHASGIWQFVPSTGKYFGLKQNWWVDNRRNVIIATDAALTYLQKLHGMFGSWDLALAAYNAGEGTVGRAIERNRKLGLATNYENLNLPVETKNYVPKLQAIKNLMTNPGKYGLKIQTIENTPYFTKILAPAQIDAHLAAKLAEISDDEFSALNPSNNRPVISNNGDKHELLLPILSAQTFRGNLANYTKPLVSWKTYLTKRGERMESIAAKFGIQLAKLRHINSLPSQNKIKNASTILVPNDNKADVNVSKSTPADDAHHQIITQQDSENLSADTFDNVNLEKNTGHNNAEIEPEKHLSVTHKVKKGETMHTIAKKYGVSVQQIVEANSLKSNAINSGQLLTIDSSIEQQISTKRNQTHIRGKSKMTITKKKRHHIPKN